MTPLLNRLRRIKDLLRGIARMIEQDRACIDLLTQLRAARAALARVEVELLKDRIAECVRAAASARDAEERNAMARNSSDFLSGVTDRFRDRF